LQNQPHIKQITNKIKAKIYKIIETKLLLFLTDTINHTGIAETNGTAKNTDIITMPTFVQSLPSNAFSEKKTISKTISTKTNNRLL